MMTALTVIHSIICVLLVLIVLLQFGKGAEAGLMMDVGASSILPQRGNIMTKVTTILAILFLGLSLTLSILHSKESNKSIFDKRAPVASGLGDTTAKPIGAGNTTPAANTTAPAAPAAPTAAPATPATSK